MAETRVQVHIGGVGLAEADHELVVASEAEGSAFDDQPRGPFIRLVLPESPGGGRVLGELGIVNLIWNHHLDRTIGLDEEVLRDSELVEARCDADTVVLFVGLAAREHTAITGTCGALGIGHPVAGIDILVLMAEHRDAGDWRLRVADLAQAGPVANADGHCQHDERDERSDDSLTSEHETSLLRCAVARTVCGRRMTIFIIA